MPFTRDEYNNIKARAEAYGFTVKTKYRKGLKNIALGDIVLSEDGNNEQDGSKNTTPS